MAQSTEMDKASSCPAEYKTLAQLLAGTHPVHINSTHFCLHCT